MSSLRQLNFEIEERDGEFFIHRLGTPGKDCGGNMAGLEDRKATKEEIALWDAIKVFRDVEEPTKPFKNPNVLGWWLYFRLGAVKTFDPVFLKEAIVEFVKTDVHVIAAALKQEFPGDFRAGGC